MAFNNQSFQEKQLVVKDKNLKYYLSPILVKNNFKHGFFTKISSEINLSLLSNYIHINSKNCILNQIHSNKIVFGSNTQMDQRSEGDGIISDNNDQNLWIYTADCMPILFADKKKRLVAAIHCGRKGLENKIIKNLIEELLNKGCQKEDLIVAIGPSISKKNYFLDNKTLQNFYKKAANKEKIACLENNKILLILKKLLNLKKQELIRLNLKKYAHMQLLNENIPKTNIDISNLCTYESNHDFYSWRRNKTVLRQLNFISP